jgi:DnaJ-class molecular chaperone
MTKERAYRILDIHSDTATIDEIKTQYKIFALKYHPDKNKDATSTEKFQEIREAYEYLTKYTNDFGSSSDSGSSDFGSSFDFESPLDFGSPLDYKTMIASFLSSVFFQKQSETDADPEPNSEPKPNSEPDIKMELCRLIVSKIIGLCEKRALEYIEKIDRTTLGKIYVILDKYREAFHISDKVMTRIVEILSKTRECVLLNPFLDDLMDDNLYKITENGQTYIVPLWHHELVYDNSGVDFVVRCCPVLPEHMEIDEDNNIYVYLTYRLSELWMNDTITVPFGKTEMEFRTEHLYITKQQQTIRLRNRGISHIQPKNMFDNSVRKDVVLVIQIVGL